MTQLIQYRGAVYRPATSTRLYRTARTCNNRPGLFWTPDVEYARYIHPDAAVCVADLAANARTRHFPGSPDKTLIAELLAQRDLDVAIFDVWDWDTTEYVVLNPAVLTRVNTAPAKPLRSTRTI
jgi:hypothetical protein